MLYLNDKIVPIEHFPNGEVKIRSPFNCERFFRSDDSFDFTLIFENNEEIFVMALLCEYLKDNYPSNPIYLYCDFLPYGQADRECGSNIFTFKYFANLINQMGFKKVTFFDPHSPVMVAAINHAKLVPINILSFENYDLFFYPDAGAAKKYSEIFGKPYRFGNKKRDLTTGKIIRYEVIADKEEIEGKKILIIDDICMGGRTFKEAAKALHEMGAKQIDLQITHLMPTAKDFCNSYKDFHIDNFYSYDTLNLRYLERQKEGCF